MLTPSDAALVAREPTLPGLATLLDPVAFTAFVQAAQPSTTFQAVTLAYVRYKPATSCLVAYAVTSPMASRPTYLYGIAFRHDEAAKLAKARTKRYPAGPWGWGVLVDEAQALLLYSFPNDRRLKALRCIQHPGERSQLLARLSNEHPTLCRELTPLRYKPERRLVARLEGASQALLRLYAAEEFAVAAANHQAIQPTADFDTPRLVGVDPGHQALLLTWLPGDSLEQGLADGAQWPDAGAYQPALRAVGRALAAFHDQRRTLPLAYTAAAEREALVAAAQQIEALAPALGAQANALAHRLAGQLAAQPYAPVVIHGDFSADQVLLRAPSATGAAPVALVDFDRAGHGENAADLGAFAADLYQRAQRGGIAAAQIQPIMAALCAGYGCAAQNPVLPRRFHLHTAARLLRLAPEAFRQRWAADWPAAIAATLHQAEEISTYV